MKANEHGSVLIEAMVAAAIVALMLGALYRSIADSAMRENLLAQKRGAVLVAQSELDAVGSIVPLSPGVSGGVDGNYVWHVDVEPYAAGQGAGSAGNLWSVVVTVRSREGTVNLVTLKSLALGPVS